MAEHLFIRLADAPGEAEWLALDADGRARGLVERGPLAAARAAAEGRRVVLLVPGTDVMLAAPTLPAASAVKLRKMLPYALEENLADDVEDLAFAVGPRLATGATSAVVVAKERLEAWLAALRAEGLEPHAIYADAEGVPDTPATLTLVFEGARIYGRRPGQLPFALEGLAPRDVLEALAAADGAEEPAADLRHLLVFVDEAARALWADDLAALQTSAATADMKLLADGALPRLAATLVHRPGTNLLQGPYAPKSDWQVLLKPWRTAAGLASAALVLAAAGVAAEWWSLRQSDRELDAVVTASCAEVVGSPRLDACATQVRQRLLAAGAVDAPTEGFLGTLDAVALATGSEGRIENLSYRNRVMDLQLVAPSVPALDEFARRLDETQRFSARIESANQTDAGVEGRVQIVSRPQ